MYYCPKCGTQPFDQSSQQSYPSPHFTGTVTEVQRDALYCPGLGGTQAQAICLQSSLHNNGWLLTPAAQGTGLAHNQNLEPKHRRGLSLSHCSREGPPTGESNLRPSQGPKGQPPQQIKRLGSGLYSLPRMGLYLSSHTANIKFLKGTNFKVFSPVSLLLSKKACYFQLFPNFVNLQVSGRIGRPKSTDPKQQFWR